MRPAATLVLHARKAFETDSTQPVCDDAKRMHCNVLAGIGLASVIHLAPAIPPGRFVLPAGREHCKRQREFH